VLMGVFGVCGVWDWFVCGFVVGLCFLCWGVCGLCCVGVGFVWGGKTEGTTKNGLWLGFWGGVGFVGVVVVGLWVLGGGGVMFGLVLGACG